MAAKKKQKDPHKVEYGLSLRNIGQLETLEWFALSWAPTKAAVGSRIALHDRDRSAIIGTVKLLGYVTYGKKGEGKVVGEVDLRRIEGGRGLEGVVWHLSEAQRFIEPIAHPGGLSLWKLKGPILDEVNARNFTPYPVPEAAMPMIAPEEIDAALDAETFEPEGFFDPVTGEVYEPLPSDKQVAEEKAVLDIPWKNKKQFHGEACAVQSCSAPADGFMSAIFPKIGLRYRPICLKCSIKFSTHKPTPLQELARQRQGLADLAQILDSTPELVWSLLDEAGLTERGERRVPPGTAPLELSANPSPRGLDDTPSARAPDDTVRCADCGEPQFQTPSGITCSNGHGGAVSVIRDAALVDSRGAKVQEASIAVVIPREKIETIKAEAEEALRQLQPFVIRDQKGMDLANTITQTVKAQYNELETLRKKTVKPINDAKKSAQDAFNPALNALAAIEELLKTRIAEAYRRIQAEQDAALQKVQVAYQQGDVQTAALATRQAQAAEIALPSGTSIRDIYDYVVEDINLVPREFLTIHDAAVRAALKAGLQIPGIRRTSHDSVTVRS
jgi:hypothetical protein